MRTWLFGILRHKVLDYLRLTVDPKELTESTEDSNDTSRRFHQSGVWRNWTSFWRSSPYQQIEQQHFMVRLGECINKLPRSLRSVFMLRAVEEMSHAEICQELNISTAKAWVVLYRGRMHLRECLDKNWFNSK